MFSGIVKEKWEIQSLGLNERNLQMLVSGHVFENTSIGDSICTNGVCLTVEEFSENQIKFTVGPGTLDVTGWEKTLRVGDFLNIEPSLKVGDPIHGHYVTGHVDGVLSVHSVREDSGTLWVEFKRPIGQNEFFLEKASVCLNGTSLTIQTVDEQKSTFSVNLIPETLKQTNWGQIKVGDVVNYEVDPMVRTWVNLWRQKYGK